MNSQLQDKVEELERANNDIRNLLNSTEIATVFLDRDLRIRRFTPAITQLLNLTESRRWSSDPRLRIDVHR